MPPFSDLPSLSPRHHLLLLLLLLLLCNLIVMLILILLTIITACKFSTVRVCTYKEKAQRAAARTSRLLRAGARRDDNPSAVSDAEQCGDCISVALIRALTVSLRTLTHTPPSGNRMLFLPQNLGLG
ncbi:hypothetical protein SprV_0100445100 [Sparganum proliferum]